MATLNLSPSLQPQAIQTKRPIDSFKFAQISLGTLLQQHITLFLGISSQERGFFFS